MGLLDGIGDLSVPSLNMGEGAGSAAAPSSGLETDAVGEVNSGSTSNPMGLTRLQNGASSNPNEISTQTVPVPPGTTLNGNPAFTHLGTLNVGDRYVSPGQNSPATVAARSNQPHPTDSLAVDVNGSPADTANTARPVTDSAPSDTSAVEVSQGGFSSVFNGTSVEDEEERRRREREQMAQIQRA